MSLIHKCNVFLSCCQKRHAGILRTNLHLDKCFEFTANMVVMKMFQREWIEGLAYKENQALENQKTR